MNRRDPALPAEPAMRVYLVEDSPLVCERLQAMLAEIEGTRAVGIAATAREAIEGIRSEHPDVVVLDLRLAEGSGFDVLRALQAQTSGIAVYMLSNTTDAPYRRAAETLGVRGYYDKSTEFERMRDALADRARRIRADRMH